MKKTLITLIALAGVGFGADYTMGKGGNLYAGAFTLTFTIPETSILTGDYDILATYYQVTGKNYAVNAFVLSSDGTLTLQRGGFLSSTDTLTNDVTFTKNDMSTFIATGGDTAYTLGAGDYTIMYLGGGNEQAAADLYLGDELVASFTKGSHNMNGYDNNYDEEYNTYLNDALTLKTNDAYGVVATEFPPAPAAPTVPEPATATLSLLALAGMAARRRRH